MTDNSGTKFAKCPYFHKCVGAMAGGISIITGGPGLCLDFNWRKCEEFKILKMCDETLARIRKTIEVIESDPQREAKKGMLGL